MNKVDKLQCKEMDKALDNLSDQEKIELGYKEPNPQAARWALIADAAFSCLTYRTVQYEGLSLEDLQTLCNEGAQGLLSSQRFPSLQEATNLLVHTLTESLEQTHELVFTPDKTAS